MTATPRRLMLVHAHPDDESIMTGGVIAHHLDAGDEVTVVTCTLGEEGEVIGDEWAALAADGGADQLGGYRVLELTRALAILAGPRVLEPLFLGGAGRWRDSGMAGSPAASHPRAFAATPMGGPVEALADLITTRRPHVLVGYDPAGTYGHPDHLRVHEISSAAIGVARQRGWPVAKHYWSVTQATALGRGLSAAADRVPAGWRMPHDGELPSYPDERVTTSVDIGAVHSRKVAAMAAHATQITVARSGSEYALSNRILQPIGTVEHFIRVDGDAPRPNTMGVATESGLFDGLTPEGLAP